MNKKIITAAIVVLVVGLAGGLVAWRLGQKGEVKETSPDNTQAVLEMSAAKGCATAAGYYYNEFIDACIRNWAIMPDMQIAASLAVAEVGWEPGLAVLNVLTTEEPGNFIVKLQKGQEFLSVHLNAEQVVKVEPTPPEVPLSSVTDANELVKELFIQVIGVDRELVKKTNPSNVIWNSDEGEETYDGTGLSFTGILGSEQVYNFYVDIIDTLQLLGFATNDANAIQFDDTFRAMRLARSDMTCTVLVQDVADQQLSQVEVRCANLE